MARDTHVLCDGEFSWDLEEGGVAVETAAVFTLKAEETLPESEPVPAEEAAEETKPVPAKSSKRDESKERRHLAGANWLDDWTLYFPCKNLPKPRKRNK